MSTYVVLFTLQDVIHKICCGHGNVLRIVVFKKNGVQAMVEFDSIESAERTRNALQGCDIYQGCCTLKIDFSKVCHRISYLILSYLRFIFFCLVLSFLFVSSSQTKRLNVYKNNSESFDYTEVPLMGNI